MRISLLFIFTSILFYGQTDKKDSILLEKYNNTIFSDSIKFKSDTDNLKKLGILKISSKDYKCAIRYIIAAYNEGYDPEKNTYQEIIENGGVICDYDKKEEITIQEKPPILQKPHKESYQYIQIQFSKSKQGYRFSNDLKIYGDAVDIDLQSLMQNQIKSDFKTEPSGNYTAFYDVLYINNVPEKIRLKTRLNR